MEILEIDGKEYEVIGHDANGVPTIRGVATTTQDGFDEHGNPKLSTNISVPAITIGLETGKNG